MRKLALSLAVTGFLLAMCSTASAQLSRFTGSWRNSDSASGGITRLVITASGPNARVHAWGSCHPTDCDWGEVDGYAYGPNVGSNINTSARAVTAVFTTSFSETLITISPAGFNRLQATTYTRFTDTSGRTPYTNTYNFVRRP